MVKNLTASAGDTGFIPGPGRSLMPRNNWLYAPQLLSPYILDSVLHHKKPLQQEKPPQCDTWAPQLESHARSPQQEKATQQQRPGVAKNK